MLRKIVFVLLIVAVEASCSNSNKLPDLLELAGTAWQLRSIQSMDDNLYVPRPKAKFILWFLPDNSLAVEADCNRGQGSWRQDQSSLSLGPIALTRALCEDSSMQDRFIGDLEYVRSFVINDRRLFLATMADGAILEFDAIQATDPAIRP